jgi:hypothetical protein
MKTLGIAILLLVSTAAYAQETTMVTPAPPTQPGSALQIVTDDATTNRIDIELGTVRLMTHSGRYTFAYLPILQPLQGTAFRPTLEMPNALALSGITIPQKPHTHPSAQVQSR